MFENQHKKFSPKAVNLLAHVMDMTLNKAEELSRRNQLPIENQGNYKGSEIRNNSKASSESKFSSIKHRFQSRFLRLNNELYISHLDVPLSVSSINFPISEKQSVAAHGIGVNVLCADNTAVPESTINCEPITVGIPKECPSVTFGYIIKARKDDRDIHIPAKIVITQLRKSGIDINFYLETQLYPGLPPLHFRIFCPNYEPKQVWVNGKECIH